MGVSLLSGIPVSTGSSGLKTVVSCILSNFIAVFSGKRKFRTCNTIMIRIEVPKIHSLLIQIPWGVISSASASDTVVSSLTNSSSVLFYCVNIIHLHINLNNMLFLKSGIMHFSSSYLLCLVYYIYLKNMINSCWINEESFCLSL